jgi:hypothetical protein
MKSLEIEKDETGNKACVKCRNEDISVYSHCAYCKFCEGVIVNKRTVKSPQKSKMEGIQKGLSPDEELMAAHMMFMTLIRDGTAIVCTDENDEGFTSLYSY